MESKLLDANIIVSPTREIIENVPEVFQAEERPVRISVTADGEERYSFNALIKNLRLLSGTEGLLRRFRGWEVMSWTSRREPRGLLLHLRAPRATTAQASPEALRECDGGSESCQDDEQWRLLREPPPRGAVAPPAAFGLSRSRQGPGSGSSLQVEKATTLRPRGCCVAPGTSTGASSRSGGGSGGVCLHAAAAADTNRNAHAAGVLAGSSELDPDALAAAVAQALAAQGGLFPLPQYGLAAAVPSPWPSPPQRGAQQARRHPGSGRAGSAHEVVPPSMALQEPPAARHDSAVGFPPLPLHDVLGHAMRLVLMSPPAKEPFLSEEDAPMKQQIQLLQQLQQAQSLLRGGEDVLEGFAGSIGGSGQAPQWRAGGAVAAAGGARRRKEPAPAWWAGEAAGHLARAQAHARGPQQVRAEADGHVAELRRSRGVMPAAAVSTIPDIDLNGAPAQRLRRAAPPAPAAAAAETESRVTAALLIPHAFLSHGIPDARPGDQFPVVLTVDDGSRGNDGGDGGSATEAAAAAVAASGHYPGALVVQRDGSGVLADARISEAISKYQDWSTVGWRVAQLDASLGGVFWVEWRVSRPQPGTAAAAAAAAAPLLARGVGGAADEGSREEQAVDEASLLAALQALLQKQQALQERLARVQAARLPPRSHQQRQREQLRARSYLEGATEEDEEEQQREWGQLQRQLRLLGQLGQLGHMRDPELQQLQRREVVREGGEAPRLSTQPRPPWRPGRSAAVVAGGLAAPEGSAQQADTRARLSRAESGNSRSQGLGAEELNHCASEGATGAHPAQYGILRRAGAAGSLVYDNAHVDGRNANGLEGFNGSYVAAPPKAGGNAVTAVTAPNRRSATQTPPAMPPGSPLPPVHLQRHLQQQQEAVVRRQLLPVSPLLEVETMADGDASCNAAGVDGAGLRSPRSTRSTGDAPGDSAVDGGSGARGPGRASEELCTAHPGEVTAGLLSADGATTPAAARMAARAAPGDGGGADPVPIGEDPVVARSAPRLMSRYLTSGEVRVLFTERDSRVLCNPPCGLLLSIQMFLDGQPLGPAQEAQLCRYNSSSPRYLTSVPAQELTSPPIPWKRLADTTIQYRRCRSGLLQLWATRGRPTAGGGGSGDDDLVVQLTSKAAAAMPKLVAFKPAGLRRAAWLAASGGFAVASDDGGGDTDGDGVPAGGDGSWVDADAFQQDAAAATAARAEGFTRASCVPIGGSAPTYGSVEERFMAGRGDSDGAELPNPRIAAAVAAPRAPLRALGTFMAGRRSGRSEDAATQAAQALTLFTAVAVKSELGCLDPPINGLNGLSGPSERPNHQAQPARELRLGRGGRAAQPRGGAAAGADNEGTEAELPYCTEVLVSCPPRSLSRYVTKAELELLVGANVYEQLCSGNKLADVRVMFEVNGRRLPEVFIADIERYNASSPFYLKAASGRGVDGLPWRSVPTNATVQWRRMMDNTLVLAQVCNPVRRESNGGTAHADGVQCRDARHGNGSAGARRRRSGGGGSGGGGSRTIRRRSPADDTDSEYEASDADYRSSGSDAPAARKRRRRQRSKAAPWDASRAQADGSAAAGATRRVGLAGAAGRAEVPEAATGAVGQPPPPPLPPQQQEQQEGFGGRHQRHHRQSDQARRSHDSDATDVRGGGAGGGELLLAVNVQPYIDSDVHVHSSAAAAAAAAAAAGGPYPEAGPQQCTSPVYGAGLGVVTCPSSSSQQQQSGATTQGGGGAFSFISRIVATNLYIGRRQLQALYGTGFKADTKSDMQLSLNGSLMPELYHVHWKEGCHKGSFYPKGAPLGQLRGRFLQGIYWLDQARNLLVAVAYDQPPADWPVRRRRMLSASSASGAETKPRRWLWQREAERQAVTKTAADEGPVAVTGAVDLTAMAGVEKAGMAAASGPGLEVSGGLGRLQYTGTRGGGSGGGGGGSRGALDGAGSVHPGRSYGTGSGRALEGEVAGDAPLGLDDETTTKEADGAVAVAARIRLADDEGQGAPLQRQIPDREAAAPWAQEPQAETAASGAARAPAQTCQRGGSGAAAAAEGKQPALGPPPRVSCCSSDLAPAGPQVGSDGPAEELSGSAQAQLQHHPCSPCTLPKPDGVSLVSGCDVQLALGLGGHPDGAAGLGRTAPASAVSAPDSVERAPAAAAAAAGEGAVVDSAAPAGEPAEPLVACFQSAKRPREREEKEGKDGALGRLVAAAVAAAAVGQDVSCRAEDGVRKRLRLAGLESGCVAGGPPLARPPRHHQLGKPQNLQQQQQQEQQPPADSVSFDRASFSTASQRDSNVSPNDFPSAVAAAVAARERSWPRGGGGSGRAAVAASFGAFGSGPGTASEECSTDDCIDRMPLGESPPPPLAERLGKTAGATAVHIAAAAVAAAAASAQLRKATITPSPVMQGLSGITASREVCADAQPAYPHPLQPQEPQHQRFEVVGNWGSRVLTAINNGLPHHGHRMQLSAAMTLALSPPTAAGWHSCHAEEEQQGHGEEGRGDGGDVAAGAAAVAAAGAATAGSAQSAEDCAEATEELVIRTMPWISMHLAQKWYPDAVLSAGQAPHPVQVAVEIDGALQPERYQAQLKSYPFNNSVFLPGLPVKRVKGMIRTGWRKLQDRTLVLMVRSASASASPPPPPLPHLQQ